MVSSMVQGEHTGIDDEDKEKLILDAIHKRRRVPLQTLIRLFVEGTPRVMGESTLKRHLGRLSASKQIGKLKDGKKTIYCVPGESLPERMPPSGVDLFLVDEMKKLVSDIIGSGLLWVDNGSLYAREGKFEGVIESEERRVRRFELVQKAYTLFWAVRTIQARREYSLPVPRPYDAEVWEENDLEIVVDWVENAHPLSDDSFFGLSDWLDYFLLAIDFLTRELSSPKGEKKPAKAGKAASRA